MNKCHAVSAEFVARDDRPLAATVDARVAGLHAARYIYLAPEHAYVLDSGERAVGYIIGTASMPDFVAACRERWLPRLRARYQPLSAPPVTEEEHRLDVMFHPERWLPRELARHPAHLTSTCSPITGDRATGGR